MRRFTVNGRLIAAAILALVAGAAVYALTAPPESAEFLITSEPAPAGVPLDDLHLTTRDLPPTPGLVAASRLPELSGHSLRLALGPGEPLTESMLEDESVAGPQVVALTLGPDRAAQGDLRAGDLVDVYVTTEDSTHLLMDGVHIVSVATLDMGLGSTSQVPLVVEVNETMAPILISAIAHDRVDLVRHGR